jgi:hypothetical protein
VFGPKSDAAVRRLQQDQGLVVDGIVGPRTRGALERALGGPGPQPTPVPSPVPGPVVDPGEYDGTRPAPGTNDPRAWLPANPPLTNAPGNRSATAYAQVINQFAVAHNPRYEPGHQGRGETYCNIFTWDITRAMGAEIPHWVDGSGNSVGVGKGHELNANATVDWLNRHGARHGWRPASAEEAQRTANGGHPAVVVWKNPGGIGHVAVVRPGELTSRGPTIAQAGARNTNNAHVRDTFGSRPVQYWVHD